MASNIDAVNTNVNGNDDTSDDKSPESKAKLFIGQVCGCGIDGDLECSID